MANRWWMIGMIAVLIVLCFSSVGLYLFARNPYLEDDIHALADRAYNSQRPGGGRLDGASYTSVSQAAADDAAASLPDLGRAQILLLRQPATQRRRQLQGVVYLAAGEWHKFVRLLNDFPDPENAGILNNLGASLLALSEDDPEYLLRARDVLERASRLNPEAPEPLFNLVLTYRELRFPRLADEYFRRYSTLDPASPWQRELANPERIDEASILGQLERAVASNDLIEAEESFRAYPELFRRAAMRLALSREPGQQDLLRFIADQMESRYGDETVSAMLAPLLTRQREAVIALRQLVSRGADLYVNGNFSESLSTYAKAEELVPRTRSVFDRLWLDLNRVDTEIRLGRLESARESLSRMIPVAAEHGLVWLEAKALAIYGSSLRLTSSYSEMLSLLADADEMFKRIDAPHDRIRVLYYLAAYRYIGGDQEEALRLALQCLRLVNSDDAVRISTLHWLIGSILYRRGLREESLLFAKESVEQSTRGPYANGIEFVAPATLAELYQSMSQYAEADEYLRLAEEAFENVPEGFDRIRYELWLGIVRAKAKIDQEKYDEAETVLQRNLDIYVQQPFSATPLLSQSQKLLAEVYSRTGRIGDAARKFTEAIEVVERDDEYLQSEVLRVKFDDERRNLYDSAIEFEFRNGSQEAAWTYLQRYRAKLFLEFLAAFNPDIEPARATLDRISMQQRIPKDTQIVEYALLKDRLLIWLFTDKLFTARSVPVTRTDLEEKVQEVLQKLRIEDDVDDLLTDLGELLIEPVTDLLDRNRTLTIIPDRALHGLPFGALKQPGKGEYLFQDFSIVVSPSLAHFLTSNGSRPPRDAIVGFGSQNGGSTEFKELAALGDFYRLATTVTGQDVDKSSFLEGLKKASVFHYAGHSVTDAIDPLRSSILLDGNRSGPNSVTAVDISQQRLPNNAVVILSSCDSSVGNSRDGIGVRGLTSAFLIGGAGSVVGSLWPVESSSTADLMIRFHRSFARSGKPVADALREAKLSFLKAYPERSHPYYWSGFTVTGNFSALQ